MEQIKKKIIEQSRIRQGMAVRWKGRVGVCGWKDFWKKVRFEFRAEKSRYDGQ